MPEFDIDQLKTAWKQQPVQERYSQPEILGMLNRKSRNYVKYIFWISILEFLIFLSLGLYYVFGDSSDDSFLKMLEKLGISKTYEVEMYFAHLYFLMKIVSIVISAIFVVKFYANYRKIKIEENLKRLILKILRFRKTVRIFIILNFVMLFLFVGILALFVAQTIKEQGVILSNSTATGLLVGFAMGTLLAAGLIWLYYRVIYGIIMKKLESNLSQLQNIEREK